MSISRARNRLRGCLLLHAFVRRLSHNSDVTKSSSHLAERIQDWLKLTAVWPASCLTIVGKHRETGSKHGCIHLLTQPGHRGQRQQGKGLSSRRRDVCLIGPQQNCILQHGRKAERVTNYPENGILIFLSFVPAFTACLICLLT